MSPVHAIVVRLDGTRERALGIASETEGGGLRLSSFVTSDGQPLELHPGDALELNTLDWGSIG